MLPSQDGLVQGQLSVDRGSITFVGMIKLIPPVKNIQVRRPKQTRVQVGVLHEVSSHQVIVVSDSSGLPLIGHQ